MKWLAYWAVGFNMAIGAQCSAIVAIHQEMLSLIPILLPENRRKARQYLSDTWLRIQTILSSLEYKWSTESLEKIFKDYIDGEEERIRRNLVDIKYNIDAIDTLYLVTGPGRIEKVTNGRC